MKALHPVLLVAFLLLSVADMHSQMRWGVHGGLNNANLLMDSYGDGSSNYNSVGMILGVGVHHQLDSSFSLYLSHQYVEKGAETRVSGRDEANNDLGTFSIWLDYKYFEVPIQVRYRFWTQGVQPYAFGGFALAIPLSAEAITKGMPFGDTESDVREKLRDIDVLVHLGAGVEVPVCDVLSVTFDVRYSRSIISLIDDPVLRDSDWNEYTSDIMFVAGVLF